MSDTYTKLFSSITESTVWGEAYSTRIVWVTMLAMSDASGNVYGAVPGLARRANVTITEVEAALASFKSPDPYSRTKDDDGRRIVDIDGGWHLLTHSKYAAIRNADERREYKREWERAHRSKAAQSPDKSRQIPTDTTLTTPPALTPTPTPTPEDQKQARSEIKLSPPPSTDAGRACRAMREAGCTTTNPSHPDLLAALAEGVTAEVLADTVREAVDLKKPKPFPWAIATARGRHETGANPKTGANHANPRTSATERVLANVQRARERDATGHAEWLAG